MRKICEIGLETRMQFYKKAMELRREHGYGYLRISKILGISIGAVKHWIHDGKRPDGHERTMLSPDLSPSPTISYILGVLWGDGCVSKWGRMYLARLSVVDPVFARSFKRSLEGIGLHPYICMEYYSKKNPRWKDQFCVTAYSKKFFEWYKDLTPEEIESIVLRSRSNAKEFVRGFLESEGTVYQQSHSPNSWCCRLDNKDEQRIILVKKAIGFLGFGCSLRKDSRDCYHIWILGGTVRVAEFLKKISPSNKPVELQTTVRPYNRVSPDMTQEFKELYEGGLSAKSMAGISPFCQATVLRHLKKVTAIHFGPAPKVSPEEIIRLRKSGLKIREIAERLGVSKSTVERRIYEPISNPDVFELYAPGKFGTELR